MKKWLPENGIDYVWLGKELGGYRAEGYQSHMKTRLFKEGVQKLLEIGVNRRTCIMCMESNPRRCHRRFISAYLEKKRVTVVHIVAKAQTSLLKF